MVRRTQVQLAEEAEARVRKERAKLQLERARLGRDSIKSRRAMLAVHRAAEQNRFTADWYAPNTSADSEIIPDLVRVNARARQLVRDDPWAKSIVRSFRRNVVGIGITPAIDDKPYRKAWKRWASLPRLCDIEHRRNFRQIQQWANDEVVTVGEAFIVRWVTGQGSQRHLTLQCFEFEQLDRYKLADDDTKNEIRHGIEVDENGAAVAFHFYRRHPHDIRGLSRPAPMMLESMRIPAAMVSHIYDPERVRQTHGISRFRPVLRKIRDLSEADASTLLAFRAEANMGLIIKGGDDSMDPLQLDGLNVAYLSPDEEVTPFTPSRPGGTYDPFVRMQLKAIAAGVGISYAQIARDFSEGSFSAERQTSIEDRREFEPLTLMVIDELCRPVMSDFQFIWALQNPEASGDYFLRGDDEDDIDWQGQGYEWVDPEAQGKGVERMMRLGLTSRTIEANKLGRNVRRLDEQLASDGTREALAAMQPDKRQSPAPDVSNAQTVEDWEVADAVA